MQVHTFSICLVLETLVSIGPFNIARDCQHELYHTTVFCIAICSIKFGFAMFDEIAWLDCYLHIVFEVSSICCSQLFQPFCLSFQNEMSRPLAKVLIARRESEVVGFLVCWLIADELQILEVSLQSSSSGKIHLLNVKVTVCNGSLLGSLQVKLCWYHWKSNTFHLKRPFKNRL